MDVKRVVSEGRESPVQAGGTLRAPGWMGPEPGPAQATLQG